MSLKCLQHIGPLLRTLLLTISDCIVSATDYSLVMDAWVKYLCSVYGLMVSTAPPTTGLATELSLDGLLLSAEVRGALANSPWSRSESVEAIGQSRPRGGAALSSERAGKVTMESSTEENSERLARVVPMWSDKTNSVLTTAPKSP
jgi:hypothetical protein